MAGSTITFRRLTSTGWGSASAFRLVMSPYAIEGKVSHEEGEFSSVLRFIEDNWNLRPFLTGRDRQATPMLSAFDFSQPPRAPGSASSAHGLRRPEVPGELNSAGP